MKYVRRKNLSWLQLKIKKLADKGVFFRQKANESRGIEKANLRSLKRREGEYAREHLLAYAFLRGVPYRKVEPKSNISSYFYLVRSIKSVIDSDPRLNDRYEAISIKKWIDGELESEAA